MKYFVMLNTHDGTPIPMVKDDDEVALYDNRETADIIASTNMMGVACGYLIYEWDDNKAVSA